MYVLMDTCVEVNEGIVEYMSFHTPLSGRTRRSIYVVVEQTNSPAPIHAHSYTDDLRHGPTEAYMGLIIADPPCRLDMARNRTSAAPASRPVASLHHQFRRP
jgi:hypothetical protein